MKLLVVGQGKSELHDNAICDAANSLGIHTESFRWHPYFEQMNTGVFRSVFLKLQNKYLIGPEIMRLNDELLGFVRNFNPDVILIYRGTHILASTLHRFKDFSPHIKLVAYNNDDPFSPKYPKWFWRHFFAGMPYIDLVLAYRKSNIPEFHDIGKDRVELFLPWYIPDKDFPRLLDQVDLEEYQSEVVFVGHYEGDGRERYLEEVVKRGWDLKIFGPPEQWNPIVSKSIRLSHLYPVKLATGEAYSKALSGSKIALCFFSRLNRDSITRRCFEIPAHNICLMSEYSVDLSAILEPGTEYVPFSGVEDFGSKLDQLLTHESTLSKIAQAGYAKIQKGGHDIDSRIRKFVGFVEKMQ